MIYLIKSGYDEDEVIHGYCETEEDAVVYCHSINRRLESGSYKLYYETLEALAPNPLVKPRLYYRYTFRFLPADSETPAWTLTPGETECLVLESDSIREPVTHSSFDKRAYPAFEVVVSLEDKDKDKAAAIAQNYFQREIFEKACALFARRGKPWQPVKHGDVFVFDYECLVTSASAEPASRQWTLLEKRRVPENEQSEKERNREFFYSRPHLGKYLIRVCEDTDDPDAASESARNILEMLLLREKLVKRRTYKGQ